MATRLPTSCCKWQLKQRQPFASFCKITNSFCSTVYLLLIVYDFLFYRFCYNFAYVNVHNTDTQRKIFKNNKRRLTFFYILMFVENCTLAGLWWKFRHGDENLIDALIGQSSEELTTADPLANSGLPPDVASGIIAIIPVSFMLGISFMIIYYVFFHPTVSSSLCCCSEDNEVASLAEKEEEPLTSPIQASDRDQNEAARRRSASLPPSMNTPSTEMNQEADIKRPSSVVIEASSATELLPFQRQRPSSVERSAAHCSCYSLRNESEVFQSLTPEKKTHPSRTRSFDHSGSDRAGSRMRATRSMSSEQKQVRIQQLTKQKKTIERVLEKQLSLNFREQPYAETCFRRPTSPQSPIEEMFNREGRARQLRGKKEAGTNGRFSVPGEGSGEGLEAFQPTLDSVAQRGDVSRCTAPTSDEPLSFLGGGEEQNKHPIPVKQPECAEQTTHQSRNGKASFCKFQQRTEGNAVKLETTSGREYTRSGTFPRYSKRSDVASRSLRRQVLNPIRENAQNTPVTSASLSNIAARPSESWKVGNVPRAASFAVAKNETVISIESALWISVPADVFWFAFNQKASSRLLPDLVRTPLFQQRRRRSFLSGACLSERFDNETNVRHCRSKRLTYRNIVICVRSFSMYFAFLCAFDIREFLEPYVALFSTCESFSETKVYRCDVVIWPGSLPPRFAASVQLRKTTAYFFDCFELPSIEISR